MARTETSILIHRPLELVFACVANPENLPNWAARTYDVTMTSAPPVRVGTTFLAVGRFLGQRIESPQAVIEYEPNRQYALGSSPDPSASVFRYTFERSADGTRLAFVGEMLAGVFFKLAEPDFAGAVTRLCDTDLGRLKTILGAAPNGSHQ